MINLIIANFVIKLKNYLNFGGCFEIEICQFENEMMLIYLTSFLIENLIAFMGKMFICKELDFYFDMLEHPETKMVQVKTNHFLREFIIYPKEILFDC